MSDPGWVPETEITAEQWAARAGSFGAEAQAYAFGRPSYSPEAIAWALAAVPNGGRVLDLAAGTGKLTAGLLTLGYDVVAVEPLDEMRALIPTAADPVFGTAEQIPLPDNSIDAVTVGQAWHWFDTTLATAEVVRVLRPGGSLALLWNMYDSQDPLTLSFALATRAMTSADEQLDDSLPWPADAGIGESAVSVFSKSEDYTAERLVARAKSHSWIINSEPHVRDAILSEVLALAPAASFPIAEKCTVWRGRKV